MSVEFLPDAIDHIDIDKVGTSLLADEHEGGTEEFNFLHLTAIADLEDSDAKDSDAWYRDAAIRSRVIVTSAGITRGMLADDLRRRPPKEAMHELQYLASVGWHHLVYDWEMALRKNVGSILVTGAELNHDRPERQETMRLIHTTIGHDKIPLINENDSVTHKEITFGGNDILAAQVAACMAKSNLFGDDIRLFLMTDVNGVYEDPEDAETRIPVILETDEYRRVAGGSQSARTIGGMLAKFDAADIANNAGVPMWVFNPLMGSKADAVAGKIGTYFPAIS
ncbi:MAG TPA: hypothetical protein VG604_02280 [Candidatus Saccharimonadales bacterium]|nr:hypothetical protein [Candidatus Saccharimonadales bacterium]